MSLYLLLNHHHTPLTMSFKTPDGKTFETKKEWKKHYLSLLQFKDEENKHDLRRDHPIVAGQGFKMSNLKNCTAMLLDHCDQVMFL